MENAVHIGLPIRNGVLCDRNSPMHSLRCSGISKSQGLPFSSCTLISETSSTGVDTESCLVGRNVTIGSLLSREDLLDFDSMSSSVQICSTELMSASYSSSRSTSMASRSFLVTFVWKIAFLSSYARPNWATATYSSELSSSSSGMSS